MIVGENMVISRKKIALAFAVTSMMAGLVLLTGNKEHCHKCGSAHSVVANC